MKRDVIYVDDEPDNVVVFEAAFEDHFNVWTATGGQETLDLLERIPAPVVVADQRMPEMTGVELFEIMRQRHPYTKRIILTGYTDPDAMMDAINKGQAFYFVKKPWERHFLFSVLIRAIEAYDLALANSVLTDRLVASERSALLGQATARITHEMSNQLCMLPLLEMIEEKYADHQDLLKVAQFARKTYERLVGLINEVKSFMQFEQEDFPRQHISLADTVHDLAAFLRFDKSVPYDRVTVETRTDSPVLANGVKLQQVLVNLVKNAAHAIRDREDGQIAVTVQRDGGEALVTVSDNGCGMTPDVLERIWEPFFTTKGKEGNGLGLDISRRLIESHGGTIRCESTPGAGTRFLVRLPALDHENAEPTPQPSGETPAGSLSH